MAPLDRILAWLPPVMMAAVMATAKLRAAAMHRRGLRVVIVDWQRPLCEQLYDTLVMVVFLFWFYLLLAEAGSFSLAWLPAWLIAKLFDSLPLKILGAALIIAAPVLFVAAVRAMDTSWRIGIDREQPAPLVTAGLFAWTRNPIYTAFYFIIVGALLIHGRVIFLVMAVALIGLVHGVVRREERFMAMQFGDEYRNYCARVGRYCPWF
jgi:protein-S-isoprenylcysteine O-methyltransferase Ste14